MSRRSISCSRRALGAVLLGVSIGWCGAVGAQDEASDLDDLGEWMTGTFSSAAQAAEDPEFFDVDLHISAIWADRGDGRWFYVEQALAEAPDLPYRQRVYRVTEVASGLFEIQVYTLPDPGAVIGAWREETPLSDLAPENLEEREGCSIVLRRRGDAFIGSTLAWLCTSTLRGATYATSDVMITPDGMVSWDRGFDEDNRQVWGSAVGGSVFDRIVDDVDSGSGSASESESEQTTQASETAPEEDLAPE
jgi:hypothetical protein